MKPLVFQTDFGMEDGAVSAMYGVDGGLNISDLTHGITPCDIWHIAIGPDSRA